MEKVVVSVVIPTYNHEKFIREAIDSVIEQKCKFKIEILVGDDGSIDETANIIKEYSKRYHDKIIPIIRENNIGGQLNRNDLYLQARGKYIAVLDGDDVMYPGKLEKQIIFLESNTDCGSVFHNMDLIAHGEVIGKYLSDENKNHIYSVNDFVERGPFLPHSSKVFRKVIMPAEGFPIYPQLRGLDWLHHIITSNGWCVGYINETLGAYRKHGGNVTSKTGNEWFVKFYMGHAKALEYAKKTGVNMKSIIDGKRALVLDAIRKSLFHNNYEFYEFVMSEIACNGVQLSLYDRAKFVAWHDHKAMFLFRVFLYKVKNKQIN